MLALLHTSRRLCIFLLLDALGIDAWDLMGVVLATTGVEVVVGCSTVMLVMISLKLLFASSNLIALLIASSIDVSISSSHFNSVFSFSIKIFFLPLLLGVTTGGSASFSASSSSSSHSSSSSASAFSASPWSYCCSSSNTHSLSISSLSAVRVGSSVTLENLDACSSYI